MLCRGLKTAWLLILIAAIGACDGSALTGPNKLIVSVPIAAECAGESADSEACSSEADEGQEPITIEPRDERDKSRAEPPKLPATGRD